MKNLIIKEPKWNEEEGFHLVEAPVVVKYSQFTGTYFDNSFCEVIDKDIINFIKTLTNKDGELDRGIRLNDGLDYIIWKGIVSCRSSYYGNDSL